MPLTLGGPEDSNSAQAPVEVECRPQQGPRVGCCRHYPVIQSPPMAGWPAGVTSTFYGTVAFVHEDLWRK